MKKYSALDISKYFLSLASNVDENDLTNLKLQKLLYFAQAKYLAKKNKKLFEEEIEAWDLGPVVRSVYESFKICGRFPITLFDVKYTSKELDPDTKDFLNKVWDEYSKYSAGYLVDKTHEKNSPWYEAYKSSKKVIPEKSLKSYFKN